jgi:hypothetical protein
MRMKNLLATALTLALCSAALAQSSPNIGGAMLPNSSGGGTSTPSFTTTTIGGGGAITSSGPGGALTGAAFATYTAAGSWTPTDASGASLVFTAVSASYTRIGNMVFAYATLTYPSTVDGTNALIGGFPVNFPSSNYGRQCSVTFSNVTGGLDILPVVSSATANPKTLAGAAVLNSALTLATIYLNCIYPAS